jgi:hypothetical protein
LGSPSNDIYPKLSFASLWRNTYSVANSAFWTSPESTFSNSTWNSTVSRLPNDRLNPLGQMHGGDDDVDELDSEERSDEATEAIDQQIASQQGLSRHGLVTYAIQR